MITEDNNKVDPHQNESENLINKNDQHERESAHLDQNPADNGRRLMNPDQEKRAGSGGSEAK